MLDRIGHGDKSVIMLLRAGIELRKKLRKVEMELINLCDDFIIHGMVLDKEALELNEDITEIKKAIIDKFTDLMSEV